MDDIGQSWFSGLRDHVSTCRQSSPLPVRDDLSGADEWQCRIIGSTLISWLKEHGPKFLEERLVFCKLNEIEPDPYVVFTSSIPGLVAAHEIIGEDADEIVYLLDSEFEEWTAQHPDEPYRWHVHFWSYFQPQIEPDFRELAKEKYPIAKKEAYWQHSEGTMWAELAGRGVDHLWKWDGSEPTLLEEALTHWVS